MSEKKFKVGDRVHLKKLGKEGLILEFQADGVFVDVGGWKMKCLEKDLSPPNVSKWSKKRDQLVPKYAPPALAKGEKVQETVDLHGLTVSEALPLVQKLIDRAIIAGLERVSILHGVGTGTLLQAIHKYLASQSVVGKFMLDENNPGVTWVYF